MSSSGSCVRIGDRVAIDLQAKQWMECDWVDVRICNYHEGVHATSSGVRSGAAGN